MNLAMLAIFRSDGTASDPDWASDEPSTYTATGTSTGGPPPVGMVAGCEVWGSLHSPEARQSFLLPGISCTSQTKIPHLWSEGAPLPGIIGGAAGEALSPKYAAQPRVRERRAHAARCLQLPTPFRQQPTGPPRHLIGLQTSRPNTRRAGLGTRRARNRCRATRSLAPAARSGRRARSAYGRPTRSSARRARASH